MVFGNTGDTSGSGVAFTRNPANGTNEFYGEFLVNAQGEDVVAGVRTPEPVLKLKDVMPKSYAELLAVRKTLEAHFKDVQDIEFTIQEGKLFMLQTRNGKRTAAAALKFAADMVKEKLIDTETAVLRTRPTSSTSCSRPSSTSARSRRPRSSPRVSRPVQARPPAKSISMPIVRCRPPRRAKRFCSFALKLRPKTCAA